MGRKRGCAGQLEYPYPDTLPEPGSAFIENGIIDGTKWIPAEADVSIRRNGSISEDTLVKTRTAFRYLFDIGGRGAVLLLNIPPDRRGLIHENDVKSLQGFKHMLDSVFANNLAEGASVKASAYRGKSKKYVPLNLIDGNKETYWATDDEENTGRFEIDFGKPQTVSYVLLQEYIKLAKNRIVFDRCMER